MKARIKDVSEVLPGLFYFQIQTFVEVYEYVSSKNKGGFQESDERYHTFYYNVEENKAKVGKINIPSAHRLQFINNIKPLIYE